MSDTKTDIASVVEKVDDLISTGKLEATRRVSKVQDLISQSDNLRKWYDAGLRAPAIANALKDQGYEVSAVTVRRALKAVLGKSKVKKSAETKARTKQTEKQKQTLQKAPNKPATSPAPSQRLSDEEIEAKLKE